MKHAKFKPGDRVTILAPPFRGRQGTVAEVGSKKGILVSVDNDGAYRWYFAPAELVPLAAPAREAKS